MYMYSQARTNIKQKTRLFFFFLFPFLLAGLAELYPPMHG